MQKGVEGLLRGYNLSLEQGHSWPASIDGPETPFNDPEVFVSSAKVTGFKVTNATLTGGPGWFTIYHSLINTVAAMPYWPQLGRNRKLKKLEGIQMNTLFLKMLVKLNDLTTREEGQDLVEYALLVSLVALSCIVTIGKVATAVITTFTNISNSLA